jgi:hypothetical protein
MSILYVVLTHSAFGDESIVKIVISFVTILGTFESSMRWPAAFTELLSILRFMTLDFSSTFAGSLFCVHLTYYNRLYLSIGSMGLVVAVTALLTYVCTSPRHRKGRVATIWFRFVYLLLFVYPAISAQVQSINSTVY